MMKIAIVDDEMKIRLGLAKMIEQASLNYKIIGCYPNGEEALKEIKLIGVDVVITDIKMPDMDGLQLTKEIREWNSTVHCIILSGFRDFDFARMAMRNGVEDYLTKPVNREELYRLLERLNNNLQIEIPPKADVDQAVISRIISLAVKQMDEEYYKDFNLKELSEKAALNPNYIRQLFRSQKGQSITDYLMHLRVEKAKELLKYNLELKVYEVGELVGYSDAVYFNRMFKKIVGMTPKYYKENSR
ncbi:response regulator [Paenibacillus psychroresistens]|uniref:Response regulator n=1 Tax=Paenibacillus psychroresistens TaxID=1778678 RepID=A0A6B8RGS8_9BACL|nr:response regulator [Paenibacillus psychroresistens]QGQ94795.1 response regulator [Paenibacillus psychroresistens]